MNKTDLNNLIKIADPDQKINYDAAFLKLLSNWKEAKQRPTVILHSCCAPCSTYVLEQLVSFADVTIFFSNSNIHPKEEYLRRSYVQQKFIDEFNQKNQQNVKYIEDEYLPQQFVKMVTKLKLEDEAEGGLRCDACFNLRLDNVARYAANNNYDYFGSALTLSPHKNSRKINQIGFEVQMLYDVAYLPSDFKKRGGYQRSVAMCQEYDIYRQCYCGCAFAAIKQGIDLKKVKCEAVDYINQIFNKDK